MRDVRFDIAEAKASNFAEGFLPGSKLKLLDQESEVTRALAGESSNEETTAAEQESCVASLPYCCWSR
jgi:hypothetical protein